MDGCTRMKTLNFTEISAGYKHIIKKQVTNRYIGKQVTNRYIQLPGKSNLQGFPHTF